MKAWNFKIKNNPKEIGTKLESALGSVNGFVFSMHYDENDTILLFKARKRILYAWYMIFLNYVVVNGKILKTETENEADVKISFKRHFLMTLILVTNLIAGLVFLFMILSGIGSGTHMFIIGGILLTVGIALWITMEKRFDKKIQEYKILISDILEF
jgi:phosphate/sulfate permease